MSRNIILLALAQASTVVCGFVGLYAILEQRGYGSAMHQWSHLTIFLRQFGMTLLILPVAWAIVARLAERRSRYLLPHGVWMIIGTLLPLMIISTFFYVIFNPYASSPH